MATSTRGPVRELLGASRSLRRFQLYVSIGFVLLILVTGILGLVSMRLSERVFSESIRLAELEAAVYQIRGTLYRQVKEVFDDVLLQDPTAKVEFHELSTRIERKFTALTQHLRTGEEWAQARALQAAYRDVQQTGELFMTDATSGRPIDTGERNAALHTAIESGAFQRYEVALAELEGLVVGERMRQNARLQNLGRVMPWMLIVSAMLAATMLVASRSALRRLFAQPVSAVLAATERIRQGDLNARVPEVGSSELVELARGINAMAADLHGSRRALVLAEKQAMLGSLVPVVAHNVRNPLASIRATAQVIDEPSLPSDVRGGLRDIVDSTDRLEAWTHSLLSYLHPLQPRLAPVCLQTVVDNAVGLLSARFQQRRIRLQRLGWFVPIGVEVDEHLVEQAVAGFLVNAIEASAQGDAIELTLSQNGELAVLSIRDHGPGISHVPSVRGLERVPSTKPQGNGLGIPFGIKVFDGHGGAVDFVDPGEGTEVLLTLPLRAAVRVAA